jgi:methyltransferase family protein
MDLTEYRASEQEQQRTADIVRLISPFSGRALDIGARDGHFSKLMGESFDEVVALDLQRPEISHPRVNCVSGDVTNLEFADQSFNFILCAEVLEHIPSALLEKACSELERVCGDSLLIGVPFKQDIRIGRTTCYTCGQKNPPWGHVNTFDQTRLESLFPNLVQSETSFVGWNSESTNAVSTFLMDLAGNPYGTYDQDESCIHCEKKLEPPPKRSFLQKALTKSAFYARYANERFTSPHPNWIHVIFKKPGFTTK